MYLIGTLVWNETQIVIQYLSKERFTSSKAPVGDDCGVWNSAIRFQTLDEAVCISHSSNTFVKGMNPTGNLNLGTTSSLWERKLWNKTRCWPGDEWAPLAYFCSRHATWQKQIMGAVAENVNVLLPKQVHTCFNWCRHGPVLCQLCLHSYALLLGW